MTDEPVYQERLDVSILMSAFVIWPEVRHVHATASVVPDSDPPSTTFFRSLGRHKVSLMFADVLVFPWYECAAPFGLFWPHAPMPSAIAVKPPATLACPPKLGVLYHHFAVDSHRSFEMEYAKLSHFGLVANGITTGSKIPSPRRENSATASRDPSITIASCVIERVATSPFDEWATVNSGISVAGSSDVALYVTEVPLWGSAAPTPETSSRTTTPSMPSQPDKYSSSLAQTSPDAAMFAHRDVSAETDVGNPTTSDVATAVMLNVTPSFGINSSP